MATFLGMRGTGSWANGVRPENWREMIMYLYPNGSAPLTGIMGMQASEPVNDPVFHWFEKDLPAQMAAVEGAYTEPTLTTEAAAVSVGSIVYFNVSQEEASEFRIGHQVLVENADATTFFEVQGEVVNVLLAGASSYIALKFHESTADISTADTISVTGNGNEEGADMPDSITYDPDELYNLTQIWRTSLSLTKTAMKARIRYGSDAYKLAKREALEIHAIEMEKSAIFGRRYATTGVKRQPKRFTGGLMWAITSRAPENVFDYRTDPAYAGKTWIQGGEEWMDEKLTYINTRGSGDKLGIGGYGAAQSFQALVRAGGEYQITSSTQSYGLKVTDWLTSNGTLSTKTHPLFVDKPSYRNTMIIYEPARFKFRPFRDTRFIEDPPDKNENRNNGKDSVDEEYLTEGGFEYNNAQTGMILRGMGQDNILA